MGHNIWQQEPRLKFLNALKKIMHDHKDPFILFASNFEKKITKMMKDETCSCKRTQHKPKGRKKDMLGMDHIYEYFKPRQPVIASFLSNVVRY